MTLLQETRRLVLPPASNLPLEVDRSWTSLLSGDGVVALLGGVDSDVELAVRHFCDSVVRNPGDSALLAGLVVAGDGLRDSAHLAERNPQATVVALPGAASPGAGRRWLVIGDRFGSSALRNRTRRALDLGLGRVASLVGSMPDRLRGHASDVGYVVIPRDFVDAADESLLSVRLVSEAPPDYLERIAAENGWAIDGDVWSFGRPRGFASQKVVFRLVSGGRPFIVKMTQESRFNDRLSAEANAIEHWADGVEGQSFVVAAPLFSGMQGGLRLIAQSLLEGHPVRMTADPDPDDAVIQAGFRAVTDLGARSAESTTFSERNDALGQLSRDFAKTYDPPSAVVTEIDHIRDRLAAVPFPSVFMHGDFAVWNLLAEPDGRVGVLDWENADPRGVPLWDLFTYARTVGKFLADARGSRYTAAAFRRQFFERSKLSSVFEAWVSDYCSVVGVPLEAVDDLFRMCWVQQAVREAATVAAPAWENTQSTRFLAVALEGRLGITLRNP